MSTSFDPYHKWLAIPPAEQPPHLYRLLGIRLFESDPDVIAEAADRHLAHLRAKSTGPNAIVATQLMNEIAAATVQLLDPVKKSNYDLLLNQQLGAPPVDPAAPPIDPVAAYEPPLANAPSSTPIVQVEKTDFVAQRKSRKKGLLGPALFWISSAIAGLGVGYYILTLFNARIEEARNSARDQQTREQVVRRDVNSSRERQGFDRAESNRPNPVAPPRIAPLAGGGAAANDRNQQPAMRNAQPSANVRVAPQEPAKDPANPVRKQFTNLRNAPHRQIALSNGDIIDLSPFVEIPSPQKTDLKLPYPNGKDFAVLGRYEDDLHGGSVAYFDAGELMTIAHYLQDERHGRIAVFERNGNFKFAGHYYKDLRQGYLCFFQDGAILLVQAFDKDRLIVSHLFHNDEESTAYLPDEETGDQLAEALEYAAAIEATLKENEVDVKKLVREAFEWERTMLARRRSAAVRGSIQARINQRAADRDAVISGITKRALGAR